MGLWYDQHEINERSMMSGKQGVSSHRAQIVRAARHVHARLDAPLRRAAFTPPTSSPPSSAGRWKVPARRGCGRVPRRGASAPTAGSDPACATAAGRAAKRAAKSRYKKAAQHHFAQHHFGRTDAASPLAHFPVSKTSLGLLWRSHDHESSIMSWRGASVNNHKNCDFCMIGKITDGPSCERQLHT